MFVKSLRVLTSIELYQEFEAKEKKEATGNKTKRVPLKCRDGFDLVNFFENNRKKYDQTTSGSEFQSFYFRAV